MVAGIEAAGLDVAAVTAGTVVGAGVSVVLDETAGLFVTPVVSSSSCGFSSSEISTLAEGIVAGFCTTIICASQHGLLFAFPFSTTRPAQTRTTKTLDPLGEKEKAV